MNERQLAMSAALRDEVERMKKKRVRSKAKPKAPKNSRPKAAKRGKR